MSTAGALRAQPDDSQEMSLAVAMLASLVFALALAVNLPAMRGLTYLYDRIEFYSHGYLLPAVVAGLLWLFASSSKRDSGKRAKAEVKREQAETVAEALAAFTKGERRFRDLPRSAKLAILRDRARRIRT